MYERCKNCGCMGTVLEDPSDFGYFCSVECINEYHEKKHNKTYNTITGNSTTMMDDDSENNKELNDPINHPLHYTRGKMEVITAIDGLGLDYYQGNILKYVARYKYKGTPLQDLEKCQWYLSYIINKLKAEDGVKIRKIPELVVNK